MKGVKGISLIEIMIFSSLTCFALFCVTQYMIRIPQAQHLMAAADVPSEGKRVMDQWASDIKEGMPDSFHWEVMAATAPLTFAKPRQNPFTGSYESMPMAYAYEGPEQGLGALVRVVGSSETVVLESIEPPSENAPLFQLDPALRIVMIDIHYHPAGRPPIRLVRRIAMNQ